MIIFSTFLFWKVQLFQNWNKCHCQQISFFIQMIFMKSQDIATFAALQHLYPTRRRN